MAHKKNKKHRSSNRSGRVSHFKEEYFNSSSASALTEPSLILNKNWHPIDATTAKEALMDVFADKARVICPQSFELLNIEDWLASEIPVGEKFIQSVSCRIRVPEVIVSIHPKIPRRKVHFNRRNLWRRDGFRCQYCGIKPAPDELTIDHVMPKSRGGKATFENAVLACITCNKKKNNKTPEESGMSLRRAVMKNGILTFEFYHRPIAPPWNPAYASRRKEVPKLWSAFIKETVDELYWNTDLET